MVGVDACGGKLKAAHEGYKDRQAFSHMGRLETGAEHR
jgi:hypothetical protein